MGAYKSKQQEQAPSKHRALKGLKVMPYMGSWQCNRDVTVLVYRAWPILPTEKENNGPLLLWAYSQYCFSYLFTAWLKVTVRIALPFLFFFHSFHMIVHVCQCVHLGVPFIVFPLLSLPLSFSLMATASSHIHQSRSDHRHDQTERLAYTEVWDLAHVRQSLCGHFVSWMLVQYSLVQWNWFSVVTGCIWVHASVTSENQFHCTRLYVCIHVPLWEE